MAEEKQQVTSSCYQEKLHDGKVLLFTRNGIFHSRIYTGNRRYLYRTLGTRSLDEARKTATRLFYETEFQARQGMPVHPKTFGSALNDYIAMRQKDHDQGLVPQRSSSSAQRTSKYMLRQITRVSKFWHAYCGKTAVERIDNDVLRGYISWRKDFYHRLPAEKRPKNARLNPADKTLQWELTFAKSVLKWAHSKGYRGRAPLPDYAFSAKNRIVRPAFTLQEYRHLYAGMRRWIKAVKNPRWRYSRELLRDYVLILANTGMRVGEANSLTAADVEPFTDNLGRRNYRFNVRGKTGKRTVIARTTSRRAIERNIERNKLWATELSAAESKFSEAFAASPWFFRMADGGQIITLIDQFKKMLESIELTHSRDGDAFSLYSLRHFYAVQQLRKGIPVWDLARNMGTSVEIIQQYYGRQADTILLADTLGN